MDTELIDNLAQPVLTVDAQGLLHYANPSGKQELKSSRCLWLEAKYVKAAFAPDHQTLCQAIKKAAQGLRSLVRLRILVAGRNDELLVLVTPLQGESGLVALQLERATMCDPSLLCLLSRSYRLTAAEERVLSLLCDGQDVAEIAQTLEVATSTIRSHVIALRHKTSVSSIRQLIQRIALLPALAGVATTI